MHPKTALLGVFRPLLGVTFGPVLAYFLTQTCFGIGPKMVQKRVEKRNFLQLNVFDPFWDLFWNPFLAQNLTESGFEGPQKVTHKWITFGAPI